MSTSEGGALTHGWTSEMFKTEFPTLRPLILEEWPDVDGDALVETSGDLARVVDLIVDRTRHTKTLVRHMLHELHVVASHPPTSTLPANGASTLEAQFHRVLSHLERKAADLAAEMRGTVLHSEGKIRDNLWTSLLVALGLGFIFGIFRRRQS